MKLGDYNFNGINEWIETGLLGVYYFSLREIYKWPCSLEDPVIPKYKIEPNLILL